MYALGLITKFSLTAKQRKSKDRWSS